MLKRISIAFIALLSLTGAHANELTITEDINVYLVAGPSNKYRILGSMKAGDAVTSLNEVSGDYSKVKDGKGREGWTLTQHLVNKPSFRTLLPQTQQKLTETELALEQSNTQLTEMTERYELFKQQSAESLAEQRERVTTQGTRINELEQENSTLSSQLNEMQSNLRFMWSQQGAMIAGIGFILGLIVTYLPRPSRRRKDHNYIR
ncbi:TIGR04211 family SH3 domain-containing protein [Ferrimonas lipolytica]|uniref:TIGR04211 family SH3 domain-containing protein n=1 Tax=Ferrimonas lipolytica TaxID=2724191 RepID=A0A6H1UGJ3_9GAMM|nr:TIGR04211 family SH3 domain-containing protein [Ferrimonas lipolytica]QIZ77749.1 TIGR04211 family SH3 domain-containing protein [Ferrimonas lipolytica]